MTTSLAERRLYLCIDLREDLDRFVTECVEGGVDVVQLREKHAAPERLVEAGTRLAALCRDLGVPFVMNDDPHLALACGADGVHVGQDDVSVERCRELLGDEAIVGLSTHADAEFAAALTSTASYLSAGPITETPTKPGRKGTGIDYALRATRGADRPVFVTGGVNGSNIASLIDAGLEHFVVVRALSEASDPRSAARAIRDVIDASFA